ncbi:MAG: ParB N-terminal domain-containing protein [Candidatus Bathyarchaeota archaeon]|nr:MAG: ParB N-terminal domain-containing protein [Candidatus Bathyarchaeota archaeon]
MEDNSLDLRIVSLDTLVLHEREEIDRREILIERITDEGILRNPIVAAAIGDGDRLLILDGVHRYFALKHLGCKDTLVQVVDYHDESIQLYTWCRLIPDLPNFFTKIKALGLRTRRMREEDDVATFKSGTAYGYVREANRSSTLIEGDNLSLDEKTEKLQQILNSNGGLPRVRYEDMDRYLKSGEVEGGFVVGIYTKDDVVKLAGSKTKLPAGTTRHIIPGRVLNIDVSIDLLKADTSVEKKNELLAKRIKRLATEGRIRYYPESVWLFDE